MGVLFVEEDLGVVFDHADRIMLMQSGRIVTQGSRIAMRDDPLMVALLANKAIPPAAPPV
jgi:branched-chain amino acid transport system ATP-binding protein